MIARLLCHIGYHRFPGWGERVRGIGDSLPWALCTRCGRVL